jgi:hypothetical protein
MKEKKEEGKKRRKEARGERDVGLRLGSRRQFVLVGRPLFGRGLFALLLVPVEKLRVVDKRTVERAQAPELWQAAPPAVVIFGGNRKKMKPHSHHQCCTRRTIHTSNAESGSPLLLLEKVKDGDEGEVWQCSQ